jgi:hypothetical protein
MILNNWLAAGRRVMGDIQGHPTVADGTFVQYVLPVLATDLGLQEGEIVATSAGEFTLGSKLK